MRPVLSCLDERTLKLSGFPDALRVRAAELRADFPSRHAWDAFFRDAPDMGMGLPGERPRHSACGGAALPLVRAQGGQFWACSSGSGTSDRPSEELLRQVFCTYGDIRHVDIPMLDP